MKWPDDHRETFELNRLSWDERVEAHWQSAMYRQHAADLRAGKPSLRDHVLRDVGDVSGQSLVHLQCHMGMETLSWAMLGADAVGLDFSQPAIDKAEQLRDELKLDAAFVCANVYDAAEAIGRTFDIVFISVGAICWLPDIDRWAQVVRSMLNPGGRLYMNESHPFLDAFEDSDDGQGIAIKYPYLNAERLMYDEGGSYAATDTVFQHNKIYFHIHSISAVLNALIGVGLVIDRLTESNHCVWPRFKMMKQTGPDGWQFTDPALQQLPNMYTLLAHAR